MVKGHFTPRTYFSFWTAKYWVIFFRGLLCLILAEPLWAAQIVHLGENFVIIDAGSEEGLIKNSQVCFKLGDAEGSLCGKVDLSRKRLSSVKLSKSEIARLSLGLLAKSYELDDTVPHKKINKKELIKIIEEIVAKDRVINPQEAVTPNQEVPKEAKLQWTIAWIIEPIRTYHYRLPSYSLENELSGQGKLWTAADPPALAPFGVEIEMAWLWSKESSWALGVHRQALISDKASANYSAIDQEERLDGQIDASAFGLRMDWQKRMLISDSFLWLLHPGLDLERSTLVLTENLLSSGDRITGLKSRLDILSLRLGADILYHLLGIDWRIGVTGLIPLLSRGSTVQEAMLANSDASEVQAENVDRDLVAALDHRKSSFSLQILLAMAKSF